MAPCSLVEVYWYFGGMPVNLFYLTAWHHIWKDCVLHTCHCENLRPHIIKRRNMCPCATNVFILYCLATSCHIGKLWYVYLCKYQEWESLWHSIVPFDPLLVSVSNRMPSGICKALLSNSKHYSTIFESDQMMMCSVKQPWSMKWHVLMSHLFRREATKQR